MEKFLIYLYGGLMFFVGFCGGFYFGETYIKEQAIAHKVAYNDITDLEEVKFTWKTR